MTAQNNLKRYGTQATLSVPNGPPVYDPSTGETTTPTDDVQILMVISPLETNDSDFGLSHFVKSEIYFMPVDTDYVVRPGIGTDSYITDDYRSYDLQAINTIIRNNVILCYTALVQS